MAIPLSMPNSDDIEDIRRLDMLLEQLLITLRQVLIQRRRVAAASMPARPVTTSHLRHREGGAERTRMEVRENESDMEQTTTRVSAEEEHVLPSVRLPLPDLVIDSPSPKERPSRTCEERTRRDNTNWFQDDSELIRLAGQLLDQEEVDAKGGGALKKEADGAGVNVLSLMCPLLGNSVWTTVALLVVWGLLSRAR